MVKSMTNEAVTFIRLRFACYAPFALKSNYLTLSFAIRKVKSIINYNMVPLVNATCHSAISIKLKGTFTFLHQVYRYQTTLSFA